MLFKSCVYFIIFFSFLLTFFLFPVSFARLNKLAQHIFFIFIVSFSDENNNITIKFFFLINASNNLQIGYSRRGNIEMVYMQRITIQNKF